MQTEPLLRPIDSPPDPQPIMRVAMGFMAAKHLFAASEAGLFAALADGPLTAAELAARTGLSEASARLPADAMVALGLLDRDGELYRNGHAAAFFLSGETPADLRPFLRFMGRLSWRLWTGFEDAIRDGAAPTFALGDEDTPIFSEGVEAITAGAAHALAAQPELAAARRLLDVAGGTGSFLLAALASNPALEGTVVELPNVAAIARERLASEPRASVVAADVLAEPLPPGHDAILAANLIHLLSEEQMPVLLTRLRAAAPEGATLLLVDFWLDPTRTQPLPGALMSGEFFLFSGGVGRSYSEHEFRPWLEAAGWEPLGRRELAGPQSLLVARAA